MEALYRELRAVTTDYLEERSKPVPSLAILDQHRVLMARILEELGREESRLLPPAQGQSGLFA